MGHVNTCGQVWISRAVEATINYLGYEIDELTPYALAHREALRDLAADLIRTLNGGTDVNAVSLKRRKRAQPPHLPGAKHRSIHKVQGAQ